jgi:hypothetical protein
MSPSDLKAAAASFGISLPDDFNISSLASFGKGGGAVGLPSASLPPPHSSTAAQGPRLNSSVMSVMRGIVPATAGMVSEAFLLKGFKLPFFC